MLVLSRRVDEVIEIGSDIKILVVGISTGMDGKPKVRLGIDAPKDVTVHREEVADAIRKQRGEA